MTGPVWDSRRLPSGVYAIRRDGVEVATLAMLPELGQQPTVAALVARLLADTQQHHTAGQAIPDTPASPVIDWGWLGWDNAHQHDTVFADLGRIARTYPSAVQRYLLRRWNDLGLHRPLSIIDMDTWDRIVRSAPQVVAQDTDAEHHHSPGAVA